MSHAGPPAPPPDGDESPPVEASAPTQAPTQAPTPAAGEPARKPARKPADDKKSGLGDALPGGMSTVLALGVALLAAVGVSGGVLVRAVRTTPGTFVLVLGILLVLAAVLQVATRKAVLLTALVLVVAFSLFALIVGASSVDQRDMPAVALSAATESAGADGGPGKVTLTVTATGSGLRPGENMLLQVQGLDEDLPLDPARFEALRPQCADTVLRTPRQEQEATPGYAEPAGDLLLWTQGGPDADGAVTLESSLDVDASAYTAVCAVAIYNASDGPWVERAFDRVQGLLQLPTGKEPRSSLGFLELEPAQP